MYISRCNTVVYKTHAGVDIAVAKNTVHIHRKRVLPYLQLLVALQQCEFLLGPQYGDRLTSKEHCPAESSSPALSLDPRRVRDLRLTDEVRSRDTRNQKKKKKKKSAHSFIPVPIPIPIQFFILAYRLAFQYFSLHPHFVLTFIPSPPHFPPFHSSALPLPLAVTQRPLPPSAHHPYIPHPPNAFPRFPTRSC
jgi:hypothetical protein